MAPDDLLAMVIAPDREVIQALKNNENHQKRRASVDRSLETQAEEGAVEKMCLCAGRYGEKLHSRRECGSGRFPERDQQAALAGPVDKRKKLPREPV